METNNLMFCASHIIIVLPLLLIFLGDTLGNEAQTVDRCLRPAGCGLCALACRVGGGCGGGGDNVGSNTVKGVVESNGEWIWTVRTNGGFYTDPEPSVNQQSVALFRIDSGDQTLKQYDAGSTEDSFGGPSQSGAASGAIYCPKDGYCATIIGGHTQYALYTRLAGGAASTLAEVINRISAKTPLDPSEYDTTLCEPILIDGGRVTGQMEAANALQPWRQAYFADASETNGVVRWVPRGGDVVGTFTTADLAARPDGDAPPAVIERERKTPIELARRVTVTFTDKSFDYQDGAVASDERQVGDAVGEELQPRRQRQGLVRRMLVRGGPEEIRLEEIETELVANAPPDLPLDLGVELLGLQVGLRLHLGHGAGLRRLGLDRHLHLGLLGLRRLLSRGGQLLVGQVLEIPRRVLVAVQLGQLLQRVPILGQRDQRRARGQ